MSRTRIALRSAPPQGLGAVAVIVVLVLLASMAAALLRIGQQGQTASTQELLGARATAAARSGLEWGLYQAFKGAWTTCSNTRQTIDAGNGLKVTVSCDSRVFNEGETDTGTPHTVRVFTLDAVACSSATACPDAVAAVTAGYVERRRQVQAIN
jgi:MSHA biogenesis protein MshP